VIRPFDLLDVPLLAQLESQGTSLFSEYALTRKRARFRQRWLAFLALQSRAYTVVSPNPPVGFAQMRTRATGPRAIVTFVAPGLDAGNGITEVWAQLLEALGVAAGEMGLHRWWPKCRRRGRSHDLTSDRFCHLVTPEYLRRQAGPSPELPDDLSLRSARTRMVGAFSSFTSTPHRNWHSRPRHHPVCTAPARRAAMCWRKAAR